MDFVLKSLPSDQCSIEQRIEIDRQINGYNGYPAGQDAMSNFDYQQMFGELENGFIDLKIGYHDPTAANHRNNFSPIEEQSIDAIDGDYSLLSNGLTNGNSTNLTNLTANHLSHHPNGHPNGHQTSHLTNGSAQFGHTTNGQFNGAKYGSELNHHQLNGNQIAQSYDFAKIANEFKEKKNDVLTAITLYSKAIELNPLEFRFYCNRSICLQQANRVNEALEDANSAITLNPNARKPLLRKAEILFQLNKYNDAENILNYSLKLDTATDATDIADDVIQDEMQKLIKTVLTKCGISSPIIEQANHCRSIEEAMDYAFGKQMEEKLNSQNFAPPTTTAASMVSNEKSYASAIRSGKNSSGNYNRQPPTILNLKSLDSQETIDYLTDEELTNISTPNRKLSINEDLFNLQSPSLKKDPFSFNQFETAKHLMQLNGFIENGSLASLSNGSGQYTTSQQQPIDIPGMNNRKRNSISLCEQSSENGSFSVRSLNFDRFSTLNDFDLGLRRLEANDSDSIYSKSLGSNLSSFNRNYAAKQEANNSLTDAIDPKYKEAVERANRCTNLIGYRGLWLGNVSSSCSRERLISIFKKYGDQPIVHQLKQSPCVFVKYANEKSPTDAIQDLHGKILPDIVHNKNEPIRLHFECNRKQQEDQFPKDKTPRIFANGECYYWRTIGCSLGKACTRVHVPINRGIDFQVWMLK